MAWRYHMQEGEQEERFRSRVVYNSALHIGNQGAWTFLSDLHFLHIFSMSNPNSPANNASFWRTKSYSEEAAKKLSSQAA